MGQYFKEFKYYLRRLKKGLSNLKAYFWIIWNDRDWDYEYLLELMVFKLKRMESTIRNGCSVDADKDADDIKKTYELLEKVIEDDYLKSDNYKTLSPDLRREAYMNEVYKKISDLRQAFRIIENKLFNWWD